ncbi:MAG: MORN repeat-containing protein [Gammaproteobacteria bacterium]
MIIFDRCAYIQFISRDNKMLRPLSVIVLVFWFAVGAPVRAEEMARPGHPGWQAAEGTGCLVWDPNPITGERVTWSGPCQDRRANGQGELVWHSDRITERYVGDMRDGKWHGRGVVTDADGNRYEGDFVDDKRAGRGTMTNANGDWYEGEWSGGFADGEGKAVIKGNKYEGIWARGCLRSSEQRAAWDVPRHECP